VIALCQGEAMPRFGKNKSKYHGIYFKRYTWIAKVTVDGKQIEVGSSIWEDKAALLYNDAIKRYGLTNKRFNIVTNQPTRQLTPDMIERLAQKIHS
jgi:hypothetical protein